MLILSRREGESVMVGDSVVVTVVEIGAGRVRIGISAPRDVPVHREEIAKRIAEREVKSRPWVGAVTP